MAQQFGDTIASQFMLQVWPAIAINPDGEAICEALRKNGLLNSISAEILQSSGGVDSIVPGGFMSQVLGLRSKAEVAVRDGISNLICSKILSAFAGHPVYPSK